MAELKEKEPDLPDLAPAGLALLFIFGLLMWYDQPRENGRPFDPYTQHQVPHIKGYAYESWLWQDPFGVDLDSNTQKNQYHIEFNDSLEKGSNLRYKIHKKMDLEPLGQKTGSEGQCDYQLNKIVSASSNDPRMPGISESGVKILAPLLKVQPNTLENKELRTRQRYAVIAGLIESGYSPSEPDRLHFCAIQRNSSSNKYDVRWEHYFHQSRDKPGIIVAWMNSEMFETDDDPKLSLDKLAFVAGNLLIPGKEDKNNFNLFDLNNIFGQDHFGEITEKHKNIAFIKPAGTDSKELTEKLIEELIKRQNIKEPSDLMVITEQDSENVRNFSHSFRKTLCNSLAKEHDMNMQPIVASACEIKNVFYLKGLDAYLQTVQKQDKNEGEQATNKRAERLSVVDMDNPTTLALGPRQLDYFHRLAEQIKGTHEEISLKKRDSGIKAVGIFGSDIYDKLLIFGALRAEMPNMLVFTTDLDAQMFHPKHWLSARNLVVASHFNLLLNEEYQKQFPAFRDSQQTNIFYRTIGIVKDDIEKFENTSPQIFEVGRNGPIRLPQEKNEDLKYHPPDHGLEQVKIRIVLLILIIFPLSFFYGKIRADSGKLSMGILQIFIVGSLQVFIIAWFFATNELGEPLSFTDGTSLWPPIFIQLIAALLAWGLFTDSATRYLDENFRHLNRQYFQTDLTDRRRPSGIPLRAFLSLIIIAITIYIYALNEVKPAEFQFERCLALLFLVELICLLATRNWKGNSRFKSFRDWIKKDYCRDKKDYESCLWREYYYYGRFDQRVSRVAAIWPLFAIIETILIYLVPPWPSPCRGPTCTWASWTWVTTFSVSMTFLFFILDAVGLSRYWIRKLRTQHLLLADRIPREDESAFWVAIRNKPLESLENIVKVVAERTAIVDKLIYYPMLCIMLMLFARITYFDNQDFPLSKGITFAISIASLFFFAFMLRNEASKLKHSVIESVRKLDKNSEETETVIKRINEIREGAFQPMFEQPVMRALLIILASISLFASKYLEFFG
jgi:amino acid transporter